MRSLGARDRQKETPVAEAKLKVVFLLRDLSKHETAVGEAYFHVYLFSCDVNSKVCPVVQGQTSRGKLRSFGTCCVKPFLLFPTPLLKKKETPVLVSVHKRRQWRCWNHLLPSEIKRQNILGCVWSSPGWNVSVCLENNTGLNVIKHMEWYVSVFCSHTIVRHYLVMHHLYSKFHLWISRHFLQGAELTLTSPFVRWVWKCSWALFTWGRKTTGRESNHLFSRLLTSVSSFLQFLFPDNVQ